MSFSEKINNVSPLNSSSTCIDSQPMPSVISKVAKITEVIFDYLRLATWGYSAVPKPEFYFHLKNFEESSD